MKRETFEIKANGIDDLKTAAQRGEALERLAVVEEENRRLRAVIEEVHSWAVCACFATPEDMAKNFPRIVEITIPNVASKRK